MIESLKLLFRRYAIALAALALVPVAHAAPVEIATGMMKGSGLRSDTDLVFPAPGNGMLSQGKLTVQVNDLGFAGVIFEPLQSLSFSVTNSTGTFASHVGEGSMSLDIPTPDFYSLHIMGTPNPAFGVGVITWSVNFEPFATVPLPASFWFLIAGIAWAIGLQRKRARLAGNGSSGFISWGSGPALAY